MNPKSVGVLSLEQWFWGLEASLRLFVTRFRLHYFKPTWLQHKIQFSQSQLNDFSTVGQLVPTQVIAMHESVRLAARVQPGNVACLPRSLVLADMLQARDMPGKVVIGVAKQGDQFASHAWVELDNRIVAEPERIAHDFNQLSR